MGTAILRGISAALLTTLLTLLAGLAWVGLDFGEISSSLLIDVGLILSTVVGGYMAGKDGRHWLAGGLAGVGYVGVAILLLALFYPISLWGAVQVLGQGLLIGGITGIIGAAGWRNVPLRPPRRSYTHWPRYPLARDGFDSESFKSRKPDYHVDDWNSPMTEEKETRETIYPARPLKRSQSRWWEDEL